MNDKQAQEEEFVKPKDKGGRPRKHVPKTGVTRETRIPIDGTRDILAIEGKDPNYHYYWEVDDTENGARIQRRLEAGYEFVQANKMEYVVRNSVYQSSQQGSIIRVPAGSGRFHYLMRIPMQWYKDDMNALEQKNKELEQSAQADTSQGQYLKEFKITRK